MNKIKFIILVSDEDERNGRFKSPCLVKVAIQSPFSFTEEDENEYQSLK
ncbi:MAG: hypothetical protein ACLFUB_13885 [Cyclobacteriaceae bacterium]